MQINITPEQLQIIHYALDQHASTMRRLCADIEREPTADQCLLPEFRSYVREMEAVQEFLPLT